MANYYTLFSEVLELRPGEREWVERMLTAYDHLYTQDHDYDPDKSDHVELRNIFDCEDDEFVLLEAKVINENLFISSEENADPKYAADFIQALLKKFRNDGDDIFFINWANTCSKPKAGEFGGGVMMITKNEIMSIGSEGMQNYLVSQLGCTCGPAPDCPHHGQ